MQASNTMQNYRLRKDLSGLLLLIRSGLLLSIRSGLLLSIRSGLLLSIRSGLLLSISILLISPAAQAVKMGQVVEISELGQPLEASIELTQINGLEANDITVTLGTLDDFDLSGVDYSSYLDSIEIEVLVTSNNQGSIRLFSEIPLNDPFLTLLLQMQWDEGLVLQEYSILPEMPVFSTAPQDPVQTASSSESGQVPDGVLNIPDTGEPQSEDTGVQQSGGQYIIQPGDTLSGIAQTVRPSDDISVEQTMLALQQANPQAFPSGNINNIRPLQVLRVPSEQQMLSLNSSDAVAEVQRQNSVDEGLEAEPLLLNELESDSGLAEESDELSVVSADAAVASGASGSGSQTAAQLENEILLAEESIDRLAVENEDLSTRITELNSQIDLLEGMVVVKDEQIAELNQQAADLLTANQSGSVGNQITTDQNSSENLLDNIITAMKNNLILIAAGATVILLSIFGLMFYKKRSYENEVEDDELVEGDEASLEDDDDLLDIINAGVMANLSDDTENPEDQQGYNSPEVEDGYEFEDEDGPEAVYEVSDDVEVSLADDHLDDIDDDFYSIIQVNEDDLTQAKAVYKTDDRNTEKSETEESKTEKSEAEKDRDELFSVLGDSAEDMNPNRDLRVGLSGDTEAKVVSETADEISSAIDELEEPESIQVEEAGDSAEEYSGVFTPNEYSEDDFSDDAISEEDASEDDFSDDDFANITFDEDRLIDYPESTPLDENGEDDKPSSSIDLAVAYEAMGDINGARELLQKALFEGTEDERTQAKILLDEWKYS